MLSIGTLQCCEDVDVRICLSDVENRKQHIGSSSSSQILQHKFSNFNIGYCMLNIVELGCDSRCSTGITDFATEFSRAGSWTSLCSFGWSLF